MLPVLARAFAPFPLAHGLQAPEAAHDPVVGGRGERRDRERAEKERLPDGSKLLGNPVERKLDARDLRRLPCD